MDGVLKMGMFVFPQMPPGTAVPPPPPTSLLDISCEDENALIDGWFTTDADNSGFPLPTSLIFKIKKGQPFSGVASSAGYKDDTTKLVFRNYGTADGHWYIKITVK